MNRLFASAAVIAIIFSGLTSVRASSVNDESRWGEGLVCEGVHHEPGTKVPYNWYVSPGASAEGNAVYVILEVGGDKAFREMLDRMTGEKVIPEGLFIFSGYGKLEPTIEGGSERMMRLEEFDQNGPEFASFIIEDLIPDAAAHAGTDISPDPDLHFIAGASSGGLMAWNALWYRNDYFRRGFLSSPTFSSIRGGEEIMTLVRKTEPKPIRAYITVGTVEPDYYFGDSFLVASDAASALKYAGYDYMFEVFANGEHGYNVWNPDFWEKMFRWMFAEKEVRVKGRPFRLGTVFPEGSQWDLADVRVPSRRKVIGNSFGKYSIRHGRIRFKPRKGRAVTVTTPGKVTAIAFSSDLWRLYATMADRRFVYAYTLDSKGVPSAEYSLVPIHLPHDCTILGCSDLAVSDADRLFLATELGVQTTPSAGSLDLILPLPDDRPAERVWLEDGYLYALSSGGTVYGRTVLSSPHNGKDISEPSGQSYGDGFDYSRTHFGEIFGRLPKGTSVSAE
ncbi:MAG: hypothetical protein IJK96_06950 [Bacteroidales bacterium]|nr:hypothetical protein [Bacteroidales bacterium]